MVGVMYEHPVYGDGLPVLVGDVVQTVSGPLDDRPVIAFRGTVIAVRGVGVVDVEDGRGGETSVPASNLRLVEGEARVRRGVPSLASKVFTDVVAYAVVAVGLTFVGLLVLGVLRSLGQWVFGG